MDIIKQFKISDFSNSGKLEKDFYQVLDNSWHASHLDSQDEHDVDTYTRKLTRFLSYTLTELGVKDVEDHDAVLKGAAKKLIGGRFPAYIDKNDVYRGLENFYYESIFMNIQEKKAELNFFADGSVVIGEGDEDVLDVFDEFNPETTPFNDYGEIKVESMTVLHKKIKYENDTTKTQKYEVISNMPHILEVKTPKLIIPAGSIEPFKITIIAPESEVVAQLQIIIRNLNPPKKPVEMIQFTLNVHKPTE